MQLFHRQFSSDGPPLVILHGLYGNQANWATHARRLASDFAVYGLDARNHGLSSWADTMTYAQMADDVVQTLQALRLERVFLVGHSMGGKTAMLLAQRQPALVEKLVVVDIAPVDYREVAAATSGLGVDKVLAAALALPLTELQSRADADAWLATYIEPPAVRAFLLTNLVRADDGGFLWRINLAAIRDQFTEISGWPGGARRYDGPTLFIRGQLSDYVLPEHEATIYTQFPQAAINTVAGAGHWVHSEKPDEVQQLIREFWRG